MSLGLAYVMVVGVWFFSGGWFRAGVFLWQLCSVSFFRECLEASLVGKSLGGIWVEVLKGAKELGFMR